MIKSKKLTSKSGTTIPKDMRAEAGFFPGMAIDMEVVREGEIRIRQHVPVCRFCGLPHDVKKVADMNICARCRTALRKELSAHDA